jgi:hypothetical protein
MNIVLHRAAIQLHAFVCRAGFAIAAGFMVTSVRADLYIRDDLSDTGIEPNPSASLMYLSPDIWVRNTPMPGWNPYPYPIGSPPGWVDPTHFNPDYASPASGRPNYVYVRVRNTGTASTGTERLLLYFARASTGLGWDPAKVGGSFIDNVQNNAVLGMEITKVRKNAATATQAERDAYKAALIKIATDPTLSFAPGNVSYWQTQQEIHRWGPMYRHGFNGGTAWVPSVAFLPWHREYINRFEGLLQEADPTVKLLYWQWTQNPTGVPFDFSANFMGSFGTGSPPSAVTIGAPLSPSLDAAYGKFGSPGTTTVTRRLQGTGNPLAQTDATNVNRIPYDATAANTAFSGGLESFSHNNTHVYIASTPNVPNNNTIANLLTAGDQLFQPYAARDPFFFLLHAKVDELWARWQRKTLANLDPATTFGTAAAHANILSPMGPWDGTVFFGDTLPNQISPNGIDPWTSAGGQSYAKAANDRSLTSPPFYDTAPLTIPAMQPGQEVIMEIPWYPPNPQIGSLTDNHVCLIARIETSTSFPYGMTTAETSDIGLNTKQNNNIAWRNVSVVDSIPGPFQRVRFLMANQFQTSIKTELRFGVDTGDQSGARYFERGTVRVDIGRELHERWQVGGSMSDGVEALEGSQFRVSKGARLGGIELKAGEVLPIQIFFDLRKDYRPTRRGERMVYDVVQAGTPRDQRAIVGGQRYEISLEKLTLLERGRTWRWIPGDRKMSTRWTSAEYDDSDWNERMLDLGWVEPAPDAGHGSRRALAYYLRRTFDVEDPAFYRNLQMDLRRSDGAVVYLNGKEVYRINVPDGVRSPNAYASRVVEGLERKAYFPVRLDPLLLRRGKNILAVELRRAENNHGHLAFDVGINANTEARTEAPLVEFTNLSDGKLFTVGRPAVIRASALKTNGTIKSASLYVGEKLSQTLSDPPFDFRLNVLPGPNRIRVTVTDNEGIQSSSYSTITGVKNVPPVVRITQPGHHTEIEHGEAVVAVASATDSDGRISRVDFYVHDSYIIGAAGRKVGSATKAPFVVTINDFKVGHAMITAVATDNGGERTAAAPIMVMVREKSEANDHVHR